VSETIFGAALPVVTYAEDATGLTIGTQFVPAADGHVTAVRLYTSSPAPLDPIDWKLCNADGSTVLASGTWAVGQPGGAWIEAALSPPVTVVANQTYVVTAGVLKRYVAAGHFFDVPTGAAHVTAPQGGGRFAISSGYAFPTTLFNNSGYFVDIAFTPSSDIGPMHPPIGSLWAFGDPLTGTLAVLRAVTAPGDTSITWGTQAPDTQSTGAPALPFGLVASDGETSQTNADSTATVRVAIWAQTAAEARRLASWTLAVLLASHGDGANVRHYGRSTGLLSTRAEIAVKTSQTSRVDTGGFQVCSFTVAARLLPVSI
jgi:hypothetical protein